MKLNETLDRYQSRLGKEEHQKNSPQLNAVYVVEVESTHSERLNEILKRVAIGIATNNSHELDVFVLNTGPSSLIFTNFNVATTACVPVDCLRYISRNFYLPHSCHDPAYIASDKYLEEIFVCTVNLHERDESAEVSDCSVLLKVQCYPKDLEPFLATMIFEKYELFSAKLANTQATRELKFSKGKYTHLLQCVYIAHDGIFRFGVSSAGEAAASRLTFDAMSEAILDTKTLNYAAADNDKSNHAVDRQPAGFSPASRAYFKMKEIVDYHLPMWGWIWPRSVSVETPSSSAAEPSMHGCVAVDVGASPGGWTQCLAGLCSRVISVDPGLLRDDVAALGNVVHVRELIQADETQRMLRIYQTSQSPSSSVATAPIGHQESKGDRRGQLKVAVCDINVEPRSAAALLTEHVVPHMIEACRCHCGRGRGTGRGRGRGDPADQSACGACCGLLVLTLKLVKRPSARYVACSFADASAQLSGAGCWDARLVHLGANSINERTLVCRVGGHCALSSTHIIQQEKQIDDIAPDP